MILYTKIPYKVKLVFKHCYLYFKNHSNRLYFFFSQQKKKLRKLHLGCGNIHLPWGEGYINIDISPNSAADMVFNIQKIGKYFRSGSVSEILIIHTISYLRLFDARHFLLACFNILETGGKLIAEFPDVVKCSEIIITNNNIEKDESQYIEGIRGLYAFDLAQIKNKIPYVPYAFGWSANHMKYELTKIGFKSVSISDGNMHERPQRDTRIVALK
jgi:hypothetical protein